MSKTPGAIRMKYIGSKNIGPPLVAGSLCFTRPHPDNGCARVSPDEPRGLARTAGAFTRRDDCASTPRISEVGLLPLMILTLHCRHQTSSEQKGQVGPL